MFKIIGKKQKSETPVYKQYKMTMMSGIRRDSVLLQPFLRHNYEICY